jgi:hypothetical protein
VKETKRPTGWYVAKNGRNITVADLLGHEDQWINAIQDFTRSADQALKDQ